MKPIDVDKQLLAVEKHGRILLWQRAADSRRLAGFWELPEVGQLRGARIEGKVGRFRHTIVNTNYFFEVHRGFIGVRPKGFQWVLLAKTHEIPLSTTAKKALACLAKHERA